MSGETSQSNVRTLPPSGLATNNSEIAAELCRLAQRIENGEFGTVVNTITVIDGAPLIGCVSAGRPIHRAGLVGLLTMAIHRACWKDGAYIQQAGMW
jgi:hypothetical protein